LNEQKPTYHTTDMLSLMRYLILILVLVFVGQSVAQTPAIQLLRIGNESQLFIDDFIVDSHSGLVKVMHQPDRYIGNPILVGNNSWEKWQIEVNGRPVLYDEETNEFKMYYGCNLTDASSPTRVRYKVCYAVSKDGIHWTRPNLGQVEWEGLRTNNMLQWGENWMRRPNVIKDVHDSDPKRRFKMTYVDMIAGQPAITKAYSQDGVNWHLNGDGKPWFWVGNSANLLGWDPYLRAYVIHVRMPGGQDSIGQSTGTDFVTWSDPQKILAPEPSEPDKNFKGNAIFSYRGIRLGMLWVFDHLKTSPKADAE
jgi:hypothetical protein